MTNPLINERAQRVIEERVAILYGSRGDPLDWALRRRQLKEVQAIIGTEIARLNRISANVTVVTAALAALQSEIDTAESDIAGIEADIDAIEASLAALVNTDGLPEGVTNLYFTEARVRAAVLTGLSLASSAVIAATDTVLAAMGQLQAQITLRALKDNAVFTTSVRLPASTVAGLPAPLSGMTGFVSDSTLALAAGIGLAPVGGGGNFVPVHANAAPAWIIG